MTTSQVTRRYWVEVAKGWAEARMTDNLIDPGGSTPQLDEFNAVMDELLTDSTDRIWRIKQRDLLFKDYERLRLEMETLVNLSDTETLNNARTELGMEIY